MTMFYTLHRGIKAVMYCAVLLMVWKLYERREVFEPILIWYDVWDNGGLRVGEPKTIAGRATHVLNSQTFVLSTRARGRFNVRLMGLKSPMADQSIEAAERERARRDALEKIIRNNWVHVEVSHENLDSLGGVVFLGPTNINANLVFHNLASASKESVQGLPKDSQYALLWSQRHKQKK